MKIKTTGNCCSKTVNDLVNGRTNGIFMYYLFGNTIISKWLAQKSLYFFHIFCSGTIGGGRRSPSGYAYDAIVVLCIASTGSIWLVGRQAASKSGCQSGDKSRWRKPEIARSTTETAAGHRQSEALDGRALGASLTLSDVWRMDRVRIAESTPLTSTSTSTRRRRTAAEFNFVPTDFRIELLV